MTCLHSQVGMALKTPPLFFLFRFPAQEKERYHILGVWLRERREATCECSLITQHPPGEAPFGSDVLYFY